MDKRARLLEDLRHLGNKTTAQTSRSSAESDDGLHHFVSSPQASPHRECGSEFSEEEESESDNELERHLPLLLPEELADLGVDALQLGHHDTAMRYLLLAQLRWSEGLAKRLALQDSLQISKDEIFFPWSIGQYLNATVHKGPLTDRKSMADKFGGILQAAAESTELKGCPEQEMIDLDRLRAAFINS